MERQRRRTLLVPVAVAVGAAVLVATVVGLWQSAASDDVAASVSTVTIATIGVLPSATTTTLPPTATTQVPVSVTSVAAATSQPPVSGPIGGDPRGSLPDGTPYVVLAEPAFDEEIASEEIAANMIRYESFFVTDGCGPVAVACSETNAVQVIPLETFEPEAAPWDQDRLVWVESDAPRPPSDTAWLDPGPLQPRGDHDVHWTGTELIVWGGATGDRQPHLIDGARFDPMSGTWRMLAAPPFDREITTRSVWAGDRMVVVSEDVTVAYDPATDTWDTIGSGTTPSRWTGFMAWTGSDVVMWNRFGVHRFDEDLGEWVSLGRPPFGDDLSPYDGAIRTVGGEVVTLGTPGTCGGRRAARWDGSAWIELPPVTLRTDEYADCSFPNQTAVLGDSLVVWEEASHPTKRLVGDEWVDIARVPLSGTEGPQGPVALDDRILVPQWGTAAIFDPATDEWTGVFDLPGSGSDSDMVWTGDELLMWGATCCYGGGSGPFRIDAWRWVPPSDAGS